MNVDNAESKHVIGIYNLIILCFTTHAKGLATWTAEISTNTNIYKIFVSSHLSYTEVTSCKLSDTFKCCLLPSGVVLVNGQQEQLPQPNTGSGPNYPFPPSPKREEKEKKNMLLLPCMSAPTGAWAVGLQQWLPSTLQGARAIPCLALAGGLALEWNWFWGSILDFCPGAQNH